MLFVSIVDIDGAAVPEDKYNEYFDEAEERGTEEAYKELKEEISEKELISGNRKKSFL